MAKEKQKSSGSSSWLVCDGWTGGLLYISDGLPDRKAASSKTIYDGDVGHDIYHKYASDNYHICSSSDIASSALKWGEYVRCQQSRNDKRPDLALIGDSHAEHLFLGLASAMPDKNIVFYIRNGPPFMSNDEFSKIYEFVLKDESIKTVVLTAYWHKR